LFGVCLIVSRTERDIIINSQNSLRKVTVFVSDFNKCWIFLSNFGKVLYYIWW